MSKRETSLKLPPRHQFGMLGILGSRNGAIRSRSERRQPGRGGNPLCGMRAIGRDMHIVAETDLLLLLDTLRLLHYIHTVLLIMSHHGQAHTMLYKILLSAPFILAPSLTDQSHPAGRTWDIVSRIATFLFISAKPTFHTLRIHSTV
jgi:hypothetical protein